MNSKKSSHFPRPYISFSQISAFENGVWVKRYVLEKETFQSKALLLGKEFADAMEGKLQTGKTAQFAQAFKHYLPSGGKFENEIRATIEIDGEKYKLYGKVDYDADKIYEFKTGTKKWMQTRADLHGQVQFYQLIYFLNGIEKEGEYIHIQTARKDGRLQFTGEITSLKIPFKVEAIEDIKRRLFRYITFVKDYGRKIEGIQGEERID